MPNTPDPRTPESAHEEEPWLSSDEVAKLWPVRKDWLPGVARRTGVRVRSFGGASRGTWGAEPTFYSFHPGDVRRVAPGIADGQVDIPSEWRTDTPRGRRAEFWGALSARVAGGLFIAAVLCALFIGLATLIFLLTVE
ncbi:hypothetical protein WDV06_14785 [Streptomyces racemochromogenes]|uniref:Uncharacterized protein n=1 Tax=Streptomyces racemochromogenes TaxID=67353 RepID=A0ABW7PDG3_9ACTN